MGGGGAPVSVVVWGGDRIMVSFEEDSTKLRTLLCLHAVL